MLEFKKTDVGTVILHKPDPNQDGGIQIGRITPNGILEIPVEYLVNIDNEDQRTILREAWKVYLMSGSDSQLPLFPSESAVNYYD